jgi:acetyltransferase-like isoleucine patch superfamily enzyme
MAGLIRRLYEAVEKRRYTPYTMGDYLRKRGAEVGEGCFIGPTAIEREIDLRLLKIGNHVAIASGVSFQAHDGADWLSRSRALGVSTYQPIVIGDNCFIGYRAILYPGVHIGPNSVVAAGSVVMSDVPPNTLMMGVPARPFGSLERYREKCLQRWALQRPPEARIDPGETWWNSRHHSANRERLKERLLALFRDRLA